MRTKIFYKDSGLPEIYIIGTDKRYSLLLLLMIFTYSGLKENMTHPEIIYLEGHPHRQYKPRLISEETSLEQSRKYFEHLDQRRSVRSIASKPVSRKVIENCLKSAATAPSGAHKQPWTFCVVSNPALKSEIRKAAEQEEFNSYNGRVSKTWLENLAPLGTDWHKPFLESAPT